MSVAEWAKRVVRGSIDGKPVVLPPDHEPGMRVPKGGSSCSNCQFLGKDGESCTEENFVAWNGGSKLPAPADQYCSDWWRPAD